EVRRLFTQLGTRFESTKLLGEQAADQSRFGRTARSRPVCRRRGERVLQVGQGQETLIVSIGRTEECVKLIARDLPISVAVETRKDEGPRAWSQSSREFEICGRQFPVTIAVEAGEVGIAACELAACDPAVAIAIEAGACRLPVEARLGLGRAKPAEISPH